MLRSDTTFDARARSGMRTLRPALHGLLLVGLVAVAAEAAWAQASREEALAEVFPGARFESERVFLTSQQQERAQGIANVDVPSRLIARYVAWRNGTIVGRAYVDTHVVRTKNQSLLVCLEPDGRVLRVEVTAFLEPPEYLASELWYAQYEGHRLDDDLNLDRAIRPIAGATLTGRATATAVRRVLGIDAVLEGARSRAEP
jgi:electron transport complex protein RnfG